MLRLWFSIRKKKQYKRAKLRPTERGGGVHNSWKYAIPWGFSGSEQNSGQISSTGFLEAPLLLIWAHLAARKEALALQSGFVTARISAALNSVEDGMSSLSAGRSESSRKKLTGEPQFFWASTRNVDGWSCILLFIALRPGKREGSARGKSANSCCAGRGKSTKFILM